MRSFYAFLVSVLSLIVGFFRNLFQTVFDVAIAIENQEITGTTFTATTANPLAVSTAEPVPVEGLSASFVTGLLAYLAWKLWVFFRFCMIVEKLTPSTFAFMSGYTLAIASIVGIVTPAAVFAVAVLFLLVELSRNLLAGITREVRQGSLPDLRDALTPLMGLIPSAAST